MAMSDETDVLQELVAVLREVGANPWVKPERIARSTLYDLDYHVALIACVFCVSNIDEHPPQRYLAHWLKILQFVSVRPGLLSDFLVWANTRRRQDLDTWQRMPRGYLGDTTHDRTVELLIAGGVLKRDGEEIVAGDRFDDLKQIFEDLVARDLLRSEREVLLKLSKTKVNKTLLRGV